MRTKPFRTQFDDLTPRQRQVVQLIAEGKSNPEIADQLGITLDGAKWHVREVLSKLGVDSREEAAQAWRSRRRGRLALVAKLVPLKWAAGIVGMLAFAGLGLGIWAAVSNGGTSTTSPDATPVSSSSASRPVVNAGAFSGHGLLAFLSQGALWVLDGSTGSLRQIAPADTVDPTFSRDGRWLAYVVEPPNTHRSEGIGISPGQLWLANAAGTDARPVEGLSAATDLAWSPTSDLLAVVDDAGQSSAIWLITPGAAAHQLAGTAHATHFVWSPGGKEIAFAGEYQFGDLSVVPTNRGHPAIWCRQVYNSGSPQYNPAIPAEWLQSGGILFWVDPGNSASIEADGLKLYEVTSPGAQPVFLGLTLLSPGSVTPDVNGVFAIVNGGNRLAWQSKTVEVCSGVPATCMPVPAPPTSVTLDPSFSPDGSMLAHVAAPAMSSFEFPQGVVERWDAAHTLWVTPVHGGQPARVTGATGPSAPTWAPNGHTLVYEASDSLWLLPSLTGKPVKIASPLFPSNHWPSYYGQVNWSGQFAWWSP